MKKRTPHIRPMDDAGWLRFISGTWTWPGWNRTRWRSLKNVMPPPLPGGQETQEPERRTGDKSWNDLMGYDEASVLDFLRGKTGHGWSLEELRGPQREDGSRGPRAMVFSDEALAAARERVGVTQEEFDRAVKRRSRKARTPGQHEAYGRVSSAFRDVLNMGDRGMVKLLCEAYGTNRQQLRRLL